MKKSMIAAVIGLAIGTGFTNVAQAEGERTWNWSPVGIGIAAPIQLPYMETDIYGLRLGGFFGCNQDVYGLDLGVAELTHGEFRGFSASAFNWVCTHAYGVQIGALANVVTLNTASFQAGLFNLVYGEGIGVQLGLMNYDVSYVGVRMGACNWSNATSYGFDAAVANVNREDFSGLELGVVNHANRFVGAQIGVINVADGPATGVQLGLCNAVNYFTGLQIGLFNLICKGPLPVMLIANGNF